MAMLSLNAKIAVGGSGASSSRAGRAAAALDAGSSTRRSARDRAGRRPPTMRAVVAVQPLVAGHPAARARDRARCAGGRARAGARWPRVAPVACAAETAGMPSSSASRGSTTTNGVAVALQRLQLVVGLLGQHQHRAVGRAVHEAVEQRDLALVLVQRRAQDHAHVLLVQRLGGAGEDLRRSTPPRRSAAVTPIRPVRPPDSARALRFVREPVVAHDAHARRRASRARRPAGRSGRARPSRSRRRRRSRPRGWCGRSGGRREESCKRLRNTRSLSGARLRSQPGNLASSRALTPLQRYGNRYRNTLRTSCTGGCPAVENGAGRNGPAGEAGKRRGTSSPRGRQGKGEGRNERFRSLCVARRMVGVVVASSGAHRARSSAQGARPRRARRAGRGRCRAQVPRHDRLGRCRVHAQLQPVHRLDANGDIREGRVLRAAASSPSVAGGGTSYPWLAQSWKWSNGNKTLTLQHPLKDAKWSDGKPLTAADVVYSLTAGKQDKTMDIIGLTRPGTNIASVKRAGAERRRDQPEDARLAVHRREPEPPVRRAAAHLVEGQERRRPTRTRTRSARARSTRSAA